MQQRLTESPCVIRLDIEPEAAWYLVQILGSMRTPGQMELKVLIVCTKMNIYQADLCYETTCLLLSAAVTHSG